MADELSLLEVAGAVSAHLSAHRIQVVVVGGSAITIHAPHVYTSLDIDFAVPTSESLSVITKALAEIGFVRRGRDYHSSISKYSVDFVADVPSIDRAPIYEYASVETPSGILQVFHLEDAIGDRVSAFVHWSDSQSLDVAERALTATRGRIIPHRLERALNYLEPEGYAARSRLGLARDRLRRILADV